MPNKTYQLQELADFLNAEIKGDGKRLIHSIAPLAKAGVGQISFLENPRLRHYLEDCQASAVILKAKDAKDFSGNALLVADPYLAYAKISSLFADVPEPETGLHITVICGADCEIDPSAKIGAYCVIGNRVKISAHVIIDAGCFIGDDTVIGAKTRLYPHVTLYHGVAIGQGVIIHSGVVIGADGFGMANDNGKWCKIHQLGGVTIGDDVEIGANTTIDRGALENTIIEEGVKLDNQIQIGHNVRIGAYTIIAGCVGIAGSAIIGKHCMIGGGAGIGGHIELADGVIITALAGVGKSILEPGVYSSGTPATEHRAWWRIAKRIMQLEDWSKRLENVEKHLNPE